MRRSLALVVAARRLMWPLSFVLALVVTLGVWARPAGADPCKVDNLTCRTSQSCCNKNCAKVDGNKNCAKEKEDGKKFGICCPARQANCNGTCTDLTTPTNCGACGNLCGGGTVCASGVCECPTGQTDCNGSCVDLQTDSANCGSCGVACAAGGTCVAGHCTLPPCDAGAHYQQPLHQTCICGGGAVCDQQGVDGCPFFQNTCQFMRNACVEVCTNNGQSPGNCPTAPCRDCTTGQLCQ
jgi:hypothetical protein